MSRRAPVREPGQLVEHRSHIDSTAAELYKMGVPFVAYVHAHEPDEPEDRGRAPWEPNWRLWRWLLAAAAVTLGATFAHGVVELVLVFVVFALCCRAALELMPGGDGLSQWRQ